MNQCDYCAFVTLSVVEALAHLYACTNRLRTLGLLDRRRPLAELAKHTVPIWQRAGV